MPRFEALDRGMQPGVTSAGSCRVGFVGTGGVATRHASILSGFPDVLLVAATDADPTRADAFAEAHGLRAVPGVDALLDAGVDAVYVCVPPFAHGLVEDALGGFGVPLFIEKPPAIDVPTAERIACALAERGTLTRVGLHWRLGEPARRAAALLAGRTPRLVHATWWDKVPPVPWWADPARSGGQVVEQAVHVLDLARLLIGEVAEVSARETAGAGVPAATAGLLRFASGALGTVTTSCALTWKASAGLRVVADDVVVDVGEDGVRATNAEGTRHWPADPGAARVAADRAFVDAVRGAHTDARPDSALPDYAEALRSHRLACAVARAATTGRTEHP